MDTRLYDSSEPGPPRGWLHLRDDDKADGWDVVVTAGGNMLDRDDSRTKKDPHEAFWGALHLDDQFWVYRILPAGKDRYGRPGRIVAAIFRSDTLLHFQWSTISRIESNLESLATDPRDLAKIQNLLRESTSTDSLMDELVRSRPSDQIRSVQDTICKSLESLPSGGHVFFVIEESSGCVLRRDERLVEAPQKMDEFSPVKTAQPQPPLPNQSNPSMMKRLKYAILILLFGLILGGILGRIFFPSKPPEQKEPVFLSTADALNTIKKAADYIENNLSH